MEIGILGPLTVSLDGERLQLGGRKQRSLLALLALEAGDVVPVDRLIEELWPAADSGAKSRLQVYVSQLRGALGPGGRAIAWRSDGYVLELPEDAVDARRFERLAGTGANLLRASDPEAAGLILREALALWRGAALADCSFGPLTQPAIARLEEMRLTSLENRIDSDLALGRAQELIAELEELAAEDPLRERLRGQQMLALYRAGRQAEALQVYAAARAALIEQLGLEPGPELRRLQEAILRQDPALEVESEVVRSRRHLPAATTDLIGRRAALGDIVRSFGEEQIRLLTLTGIGGSGKTRLAIEAAAELAERFDHGVYFTELASVEDSALVPQAVARTLGVDERPGEPLEITVADHLRHRRLLLVLDNLEHLTEAAPFASSLLEAAPGLRVLATSRTPLRLYGEHLYTVPPLALPDPALATDADAALGSEAVELFVARAQAVNEVFRLTESNVGAVIEVCTALDGLPLAIELAAARSRMLSPQEMLADLPGALELAGEGPCDAPARQRTLRATIDWSAGLLTPPARELLARLSVTEGSFSEPTARDAFGATRAAVAELVEQSLLATRAGACGATRLEMLETVREYARERLEESGRTDDAHRSHVEHFAAMAERAQSDLGSASGEDWMRSLEEDHANMRAALAWARASGWKELEVRLAAALSCFWERAGYLREGGAHVEAALENRSAAPEETQANLLRGAARLALRRGDYGLMIETAGEAVSIFEGLGDQHGVAHSLALLATATSNEGDSEGATALYERAARMYGELGDELGYAATMSDLGCLALMEGDPERATALSEEALAHLEELGEHYALLSPLFNLGLAGLERGDHAEALQRFAQGLELGRDLGYREQVYYSLEGIAATCAAMGEHGPAARLLGAARAVAARTGSTLEPLERAMHERTVSEAAAALGEDEFGAAMSEGEALDPAEAIAMALGVGPPAESRGSRQGRVGRSAG